MNFQNLKLFKSKFVQNWNLLRFWKCSVLKNVQFEKMFNLKKIHFEICLILKNVQLQKMFYSKTVHFKKNNFFKIFLFFENSQIWNLSEQKKQENIKTTRTRKKRKTFCWATPKRPTKWPLRKRDGGSREIGAPSIAGSSSLPLARPLPVVSLKDQWDRPLFGGPWMTSLGLSSLS
jgi:hypothetical protein